MPLSYNLSQSMTMSLNSTTATSYWASSFIRAHNGIDYLALAHVLDNFPGPNPTVYRGSLLSITNTSQYTPFEVFSSVSSVFTKSGIFNASFPDFGFGVTSQTDPLGPMRMWCTIPGAEYDITFEQSSPVLLNGALGMFTSNIGDSVHEWSMPAGKTTGTLTIDGKKVTIDSQNSNTWYDRQFGGAPSTWTWFELHVTDPRTRKVIPMSVWVYPFEEAITGSFASVREANGVQKIVPVTTFTPSKRTWTSKATNITYALDWTLGFADGTRLSISSKRDDQELAAPGGVFPAYEGYIEGKGTYQDIAGASVYGVVEILALTSA